MDIQFEVDSLDTVADESLKSVYVERDGKFHFDPDKYAEVKIQSSGLKKKNSDLIAKEKALRESLKKFEPLGDFDPDDLTEFQTWRENKDKTPPPDDKSGKGSEELQAQFDKALGKEKSKFATELATRDTKIDELTRENKHFKLTVPLRDIAVKAGVIADDLDLVLLDTAKRFTLNEDDKIVVLDEDGDPTDITPQKFFETLYREQRPKFYAASGAAGSGAPSSTGSTGGKRTMRRSEFDKMLVSDPLRANAFLKEVNQGKAALVDN
jgi:hypothetical protein